MLAVLLLLVLTQTPSELEHQIKALRTEISTTKGEVKALRRQNAETEAREKESRLTQARIRLKTIEREAREARARAERSDPNPITIRGGPEPLESPEAKIAREVRIREIEKIENPDPDQQIVLALAKERTVLQGKVVKANRKWHCRFFKIGCINKK